MSLKAQLTKAKKLWKNASKLKPEFDNVVTDGLYIGKLKKAVLGESESSGRLQVAWGAVITGGEFKGEMVNWWSGLKTEQNFMYLQRDIARFGKSIPEDISDLEDILEEIQNEKPTIRFKVKTDGDFLNVRVVKKLDSSETEDEETPEDEEAPDDVEPEDEPEEKEEKDEDEEEDNDKEEDEDDDVEDLEEEDEDDEETPVLEPGVRVAFDLKGKEVVGEVVKVTDEGEKVVVTVDGGGKYKIKVENLRPAPKAKVKKK